MKRPRRAVAAGVAVLAIAVLGAASLVPLPWRAASRVVSTVDIASDPDTVFRFVSTPAFWPRWHPSSLAVTGDVDHPLQVGEQADERFRVAGREGVARWVVTERETGRSWTIDGRIGGRAAGRVRYRLQPLPGGTRFEREFDYYPPNLLALVVDRWHMHARIDEESRQALARLRSELERRSPAGGPARNP